MIRKSLVLLVAALLIAGPSFATTGTVGGAGAGAGGGHSGGGHAGSSAGNAGSGHVVGGHVGSSLSGPHAHSAAHAVSARAASAAHHGPGHHHHAGYNLAFNKDDTFNQGKGLWGGCGPLAPSVAENRVVCTGLTKMQIDPTTGAPAP